MSENQSAPSKPSMEQYERLVELLQAFHLPVPTREELEARLIAAKPEVGEAEYAQFTDARGRVWTPRYTLLDVRRFMDRTGVGLFASTARAIAKLPAPGPDGRMTLTQEHIEAIVSEFCGGLDNLPVLLFLGCREQAVERDVGEDDFCAAIGGEQLADAYTAAMLAVFRFFPTTSRLAEALAEAGGGGSASIPFAGNRGHGKAPFGLPRKPE